MSNDIFVLENPNSAKPNSSGSGEAMMRAPKIGESHFMKPKWKVFKIFLITDGFIDAMTSFANLSRIKKNRIRSPQRAPRAPQKETVNILASLILTRATDAGAIVKTEVKKIPAKKLAVIWFPIKSNTLLIKPISERSRARTAPKKTNNISFANSIFALLFLINHLLEKRYCNLVILSL